eukprot:TRINITY_DN54887_c0_g1_i1.p1 TRINITY_DN54887_c0_g1~~TRINITY_DN54887_c0_g1_i1.p1  ORF type:complete len:393 (-),score=51.34 TRINITY_DN54887_c0_g1_i1:90-1148(-)
MTQRSPYTVSGSFSASIDSAVTEMADLLDKRSPTDINSILQGIARQPLDSAGVLEAIVPECFGTVRDTGGSSRSETTLPARVTPLAVAELMLLSSMSASSAPTLEGLTAPTQATCRICGNMGTDLLGQRCPCECSKTCHHIEPAPPAAPPPTARRPGPTLKPKTDVSESCSAMSPHQFSEKEVETLLRSLSTTTSNEDPPKVSQTLQSSPLPQKADDFTTAEKAALFPIARLLSDRYRQEQELERHLAKLEELASVKEVRVSRINRDLETALREVRHHRLDVEFQQLKIEELLRSNAELEQSQCKPTCHVDALTLQAKHAAIDAEQCCATPRSVQVQGTLAWTLRKSKVNET